MKLYHLTLKNAVFKPQNFPLRLESSRNRVINVGRPYVYSVLYSLYTREPWTATPALIKVEEKGEN